MEALYPIVHDNLRLLSHRHRLMVLAGENVDGEDPLT